MAENAPPASSSALPPPPQPSTGAPGQPQFDSAQGNGQGTGAHMPPSLPPVVIPQKTNPIPTAITSPMSGQMMSPTSTGGFVRRAAPEPNKRALYIGGLDARVTEDILKQIFETTGHVQSVKIIPDKNVSIKLSLYPHSCYVSYREFFSFFIPLGFSHCLQSATSILRLTRSATVSEQRHELRFRGVR